MTTKFLSFSEDQLLEIFLTHRGTASELPQGTLLRADGIISDNFYRLRLRKAYARLLASGNLDYLPVSEVKELLSDSFSINPNSLVASVELPESIIMPVEIKLTSWDTPVSTFYENTHPFALLQKSHFSRAGISHPIAVLNRKSISLYSAASVNDSIQSALMVVRPPEHFYTFTEAALPFMLDA